MNTPNRRSLVKGMLASPLILASGCSTSVNQPSVVPRRYADKPEMMAIGDSLYQGVRSLSLTSNTAPFSPPALVAESLGIERFAVPTPPRPILWDVEKIFDRPVPLIISAIELPGEVRANGAIWLADRTWTSDEAFDNVAVGGAEIDSLYNDTYAKHWSKFQRQFAEILLNPLPYQMLSDMWYSLNVCFTLNPHRREEQMERSQLDQVVDRRPKRLLVNIGSNEGLFSGAFLGDIGAANTSLQAGMAKMRVLAEKLAELPRDTEHIVFNSLIRPRTATNLMPADKDTINYPNDRYFDAYGPWLFSDQQNIPGSQLKSFDDLVQYQNGEVHNLLQQKLGSRLVYVDLYEMSDRFDGKHYKDRTLNIRGRTLKNLPLSGTSADFGGGLTGLDNMHPTVPGYSLIADAVLAAIQPNNPVTTNKDIMFSRDTLLNNIPPLLFEKHANVIRAVDIIKRLGSSGVAAKPDQAPAARS
jgi:lysophospholipase L1-like esterase